MKIVCSYCQKMLGEKEPRGNSDISHGMCQDCLEYFLRQWDGLNLDEYLNGFDAPVAAIDTEGRIIAQNSKMSQLVMKNDEAVRGQQPGDVVECQFARRPGGCGHTVHCEACAIRRAINHTVSTGAPCSNVPARVKGDSGEADLNVSTELRETFVILTLSAVVGLPEEGTASSASDSAPIK